MVSWAQLVVSYAAMRQADTTELVATMAAMVMEARMLAIRNCFGVQSA